MLCGESCAHSQNPADTASANPRPYHSERRARCGRPAPMFCAVMAASALAIEVAESMANTSYLLLMPTTEAAYTPQRFITAARYKNEMRTISS